MSTSGSAAPGHPVIEIRDGRLRGTSQRGVCSYKGIPYGASTAGANRFLPAQPVQAWAGIRDASLFGHRAPQDLDPSSGLPWREWIRDRQPMDEDCLVLNVYTHNVKTMKYLTQL
jgi:para-nitrobenzyl esterase